MGEGCSHGGGYQEGGGGSNGHPGPDFPFELVSFLLGEHREPQQRQGVTQDQDNNQPCSSTVCT